jgi:hypothetical protein
LHIHNLLLEDAGEFTRQDAHWRAVTKNRLGDFLPFPGAGLRVRNRAMTATGSEFQ